MIPDKVLSLENYMKECSDKAEASYYGSTFYRTQIDHVGYEIRFTKAVREHKRICKELGVKVL